ncbi:MAG: aspartate--tRNA ligase [Kiritimatiellia bacterium]
MLRTHTCGQLTRENAGQIVQLCGWVASVRDHGGIIFIDLRDRYGTTQVVFDPNDSQSAAEAAGRMRHEFVVRIKGKVAARPESMVNPRIPTGAIEVFANEIELLNSSPTPPFPIDDDLGAKVSEDLRMKYRYLDLRRPSLQQGLRLRHKMAKAVRDYLDTLEFIEIETPILTKSTPEGARDYLVPNRMTPGTFYALPQAPQQYKQLAMVGGLDRYFQVARCFRDEDLRADRQPEFTQFDFEMSFVEAEDIYAVVDGVLNAVMVASGHGPLELPVPRMSWHDSMENYGIDKPDLRFDMKLHNVTPIFKGGGFKVFAQIADSGSGVIKAINAKGLAGVPIRVVEEWTELAKHFGMPGLAHIRVQEDGTWKSPIAKFFSETEKAALQQALDIKNGDLILFAAGAWRKASEFLGKVRLEAAKHANCIPPGKFMFTWITEFPLFDDDGEGGLVSMHHPFTRPYPPDLDLLEKEPLKVRATAYDIVLNGVELGSGSIRIHDSATQQRMFERLGISAEEIETRFGHLVRALSYGAPPHGGIALGFDRLAMLMAGAQTIRDVIAYPKNHRGVDLMMEAPSPVSERQLKDVHIRLAQSVDVALPSFSNIVK